jgi:hypothetical protein
MRNFVTSIIIYIIFIIIGYSVGQAHHAWKWYAGVISVILYLMLSAGKSAMAEEKGPVPFYAHLLFWVLEALDGFLVGVFIGSFH